MICHLSLTPDISTYLTPVASIVHKRPELDWSQSDPNLESVEEVPLQYPLQTPHRPGSTASTAQSLVVCTYSWKLLPSSLQTSSFPTNVKPIDDSSQCVLHTLKAGNNRQTAASLLQQRWWHIRRHYSSQFPQIQLQLLVDMFTTEKWPTLLIQRGFSDISSGWIGSPFFHRLQVCHFNRMDGCCANTVAKLSCKTDAGCLVPFWGVYLPNWARSSGLYLQIYIRGQNIKLCVCYIQCRLVRSLLFIGFSLALWFLGLQRFLYLFVGRGSSVGKDTERKRALWIRQKRLKVATKWHGNIES